MYWVTADRAQSHACFILSLKKGANLQLWMRACITKCLAMPGDGYAEHGMFKDFDYRERNEK